MENSAISSFISSFSQKSSKYLKILSIVLSIVWAFISILIIYQVVEKQKNAFMAIVDSHQESIINGQFRI